MAHILLNTVTDTGKAGEKQMKKTGIAFLIIIICCIPAAAEEYRDPEEISSPGLSPRIVGGREAEVGDWPWMAALVYSGISSYVSGQFCGASLVHPNWVLTAAHCVYRKSSGSVDVVLNVHDLENDTGERVNVKRIIVHPFYNDFTLDFDIALLELEHSVSYETIRPVSKDAVLEGRLSLTMGWGKTDYHTWSYSDKLLEVLIPIVSNETCNEAFNAISYYYNDITDVMLCAGFADGGKDACVGDSGGPLIVWEDSAWKLAGIVSWGDGCAEPNLYGVYTRIPEMLSFINKYIPITGIPGDFDQNSRIGLEDAVGILQVIAGLRPESTIFPRSGDYDGDEELTLKDPVGILQILAGFSPAAHTE